jgi:hypothetical protein
MAGSEYFQPTFDADRAFCDCLMTSSQAPAVARLTAYYAWARICLPHIRTGLLTLGAARFDESIRESAQFWTAALVQGVMQDIALVPYLVIRGVISEAGSVVRRGLESIGVLTHIWADPTKVQ